MKKVNRTGVLLGAAAAMALVMGLPAGALACDKVSKAVKSETVVAYGKCGGADKAAEPATTAKAKAPKVFDKAPEVGAKATCPVMGGEFEVKADSQRSEYKGKHVVFCCPGCKPKFDADPEKYL